MRLTRSSGWAVPAHSMAMSHGVGGAPARHEVCRVAYHKEEPGRSGVHVCAEAKRAVCASSFDHAQRRREQRSRGHAHLARRSRGIQVCMHAQSEESGVCFLFRSLLFGLPLPARAPSCSQAADIEALAALAAIEVRGKYVGCIHGHVHHACPSCHMSA